MSTAWDIIIRDGLWFDGTGAPAQVRNLGIRNGIVETVTTSDLEEAGCPEVIDAQGAWVVPGFIDVHTHYDAEILASPGLTESVRHGVTTVVLGNCSLSAIYADNADAADLFSRVEAVPHAKVTEILERERTWTDAAGYFAALEELPLGPNVASLLGHSDLRAHVMGLGRAVDHAARPTSDELTRMTELLEDALDAGFLGMSSMLAGLDKLDGDRFRSRSLPSTYARWREHRALMRVLRRRGALLQSAPDPKNPLSALGYFLASCGFGLRRRLRVSLLVSADTKSLPGLATGIGLATRFSNTVGRSNLRFQHLPVPFKLYSDGIDLPVFEEFGAGTIALHLRDQIERNALLADLEYRRAFRKELDRRSIPGLWHRDFHDAVIVECPDDTVIGKSFGELAHQRGIHPLDAFLDVLVANGERNVRWTTTVANHREAQLNKIATDPAVHYGFSDAGAHLRNMAFYNYALRLLKRVKDAEQAGTPFMTIEHAVHRLTGELGAWWGIDAGHLDEGSRADFVIIDPQHLDDAVDSYHEAPAEMFDLNRMVNRNDQTVLATGIGGCIVYRSGEFSPGYGTTRATGSVLRPPATQHPEPRRRLITAASRPDDR